MPLAPRGRHWWRRRKVEEEDSDDGLAVDAPSPEGAASRARRAGGGGKSGKSFDTKTKQWRPPIKMVLQEIDGRMVAVPKVDFSYLHSGRATAADLAASLRIYRSMQIADVGVLALPKGAAGAGPVAVSPAAKAGPRRILGRGRRKSAGDAQVIDVQRRWLFGHVQRDEEEAAEGARSPERSGSPAAAPAAAAPKRRMSRSGSLKALLTRRSSRSDSPAEGAQPSIAQLASLSGQRDLDV